MNRATARHVARIARANPKTLPPQPFPRAMRGGKSADPLGPTPQLVNRPIQRPIGPRAIRYHEYTRPLIKFSGDLPPDSPRLQSARFGVPCYRRR